MVGAATDGFDLHHAWHNGRKSDMIRIMSSDLIERLVGLSHRTVDLAAEAALFRAGDRVTMLYLVIEGALRLERVTPLGARLILQRATAGEIMAEASCFADTYHCDGIAITPSRLSAVSLRTFREAWADPALIAAFATHLAQRVQDARARAEILSLKTVQARLDAWLAINSGCAA
jgi:CRP/FNR family transcriptional regulator, dissimilatory nitrate respiration regulator